jgi:hypothetical protein
LRNVWKEVRAWDIALAVSARVISGRVPIFSLEAGSRLSVLKRMVYRICQMFCHLLHRSIVHLRRLVVGIGGNRRATVRHMSRPGEPWELCGRCI